MQQPDFTLTDKVAVVTGASRGIGLAMAEGLAGAGARVVLTGRDGAKLAAEASRIGAAYQILDVADVPAIGPAFAAMASTHGRIDILVNNAGVEEVCASSEVSEDLWDRILGTNLKGAFFCAQAAARHMPDGAAIVNLCSLTSEVGVPGAVAYSASKTGMLGMTRALAAEWAARNIRVNGIGPGYFQTALTDGFFENPAWRKAMLKKIPMNRFGRLEDLLGAAIFLCSAASAYVTGQVIYVDGGYLASI